MHVLPAGGAVRAAAMPCHRSFVSSSIVLCTALVAVAAAAQEGPVVQVTGHYDNGIGTLDAASSGTVTAALIANRPALRPGEVLEFVPGVIVTQHSGDGKANQYFLRGFNLDHGTDFATFVDGMPVNLRTHAHGQGYTDLNFLIPELVGRIRYRKGPYYAEEGDFASAGAAHIGLADRLAENGASVTAGEHAYVRSLVTGSTPAANGHLLYGLELAHNDGPWQSPEAFRKTVAVLRYSAPAGADRFSITAMAYRAGWHATGQVPLRAVQDGSLDRFGAVDDSDGGHTSRYSLSTEWRRRDDGGTWHANAYAVRSDLTLFNDFTYWLDDPEQGDQARQSERRTLAGFGLSRSVDGELAGRAMENEAGVELRHDRIAPLGLYATHRQRDLHAIATYRVNETSVGLWWQNAVHWTPWLRSVAGVRHDRYRFAVDSSLPENAGTVNDHVTSPKLSLVLGPWRNTEWFINAGAGFHSNDARGTTAHVAPRGRESVAPVAPLVKTRGAEVGLRSEPLPGLQMSLALWRLRMDSELVFSGDAGDTAPSRASRRHGIELNNHYVATRWLLLDLDAAWSRARYTVFDPAGDRVPGAVGKVLSFGATVTEAGPWSGAFQLRYFGPRALVEDGSVRSRATAIAYLRTGYRFAHGWQATVDVFNLFDRKASDVDYYYASRLPGEPADGVPDLHFHPVEPRTARVTLRHTF